MTAFFIPFFFFDFRFDPSCLLRFFSIIRYFKAVFRVRFYVFFFFPFRFFPPIFLLEFAVVGLHTYDICCCTYFFCAHRKGTPQAPMTSMPSSIYRKHSPAQSALHKATKHVQPKQADRVSESQGVSYMSSSVYVCALQTNEETGMFAFISNLCEMQLFYFSPPFRTCTCMRRPGCVPNH